MLPKTVLLLAIALHFCLPANSQTITLKKVELDRRMKTDYPTDYLFEGFLNLEFSIRNNTKDTLYLFRREVEPFVALNPFQVVQRQDAPTKATDSCKGRFIQNILPEIYSYRKFEAGDVVAIPPAKKEDFSLQTRVTTGFCPEYGRKIEVYVTYKLNLTTVDPTQRLAEIKNNEVALEILAAQEAVFDSNVVIHKRTELLRQLKESIRALKAQNEFLAARIKESAYLERLPFTKKELKSNSVFVNEK